jgi:hypothetical protein
MVLASTSTSAGLVELAELADKVMEVAVPTVSNVTASPSLATEVESLRAKVAKLSKVVQKLTRHHTATLIDLTVHSHNPIR